MSWTPLAKTFSKTFSIGHGYRRGGHRLFFLHVGALASLSLAQPIFDFLSQHPQFLVAHHASPIEMLLLVVLLSLLIPGSMAAAACALDRIKGMKGWFEGPAVGLLVFLLCLRVLKTVKGVPRIFLFGPAALLAWLSCRVYRRYRTARLYLTFL